MVTPLIRKSTTMGIFANPSQGKTIFMTFLALMYYKRGYRIFSNYWLSIPHVFIDSLDGVKQIGMYPQSEKKLAVFEDFERWINSRLASTKQNINMGSITMDFGKNNCSLVYTAKRSSIIDLNVRDITNYFVEVEMFLPFRLNTINPDINKRVNALWGDDLEKYWIEINVFDGDLEPLRKHYLMNLDLIAKNYHTQEIVPELKGGLQ